MSEPQPEPQPLALPTNVEFDRQASSIRWHISQIRDNEVKQLIAQQDWQGLEARLEVLSKRKPTLRQRLRGDEDQIHADEIMVLLWPLKIVAQLIAADPADRLAMIIQAAQPW